MALRPWPCSLLSLLLLLLRLSAAIPPQPTTYIVHMDSSAIPAPFSSHAAWYASALSVATATPFPAILYTYTSAFHGFSARLTPRQLRRLQTTPGFLSAYPDRFIHPDTTHSTAFLGLSSSDGLLPAANYGESVIIGVIDTGIWPESPSFSDDNVPSPPPRWRGTCDFGSGSGSCNHKLIGARFFNKGLLAGKPNATIVNSTRDTDGHGTHTASTAAGNFVPGADFFGYANGTARGVAPRAHVAAYKVLFGEDGSTADVIAGIDQAISDGVDVISISLGIDGEPLHRDPVAIAAFSAVEKGIFVSTSTGNAGPSRRTLHNGVPWTLTVGASTIDRRFSGSIELGNGSSILGISLYLGSKPPPRNSPLLLLDSCTNVTLKNVEDKIVICHAADSLDDAWRAVRNASVLGAVFVTDDVFVELYETMTFPGVLVTPQQGDVVMDYARRGANPTATLGFRQTEVGVRPAPAVGAYSSRGPSASCPRVAKPDLVAPGSLILAAWPPNVAVEYSAGKPLLGNFNVISGSSMSCPHASGIAALLKVAHPDWSPAAIRSAMMTTADAVDNSGKPIGDAGRHGAPASPLDVGAGHVNPNRASNPGLVYDAGASDYVRLLCSLNYTMNQINAITRSSVVNCSDASADLNYPSFVAFSNGTRTVWEFHRTVTNVGGGSCAYTAEVTEMDGWSIKVAPEKLVFGGDGERRRFVVTVEGSSKAVVVHGALTWVEEGGGGRRVRSPILATSFPADPLR